MSILFIRGQTESFSSTLMVLKQEENIWTVIKYCDINENTCKLFNNHYSNDNYYFELVLEILYSKPVNFSRTNRNSGKRMDWTTSFGPLWHCLYIISVRSEPCHSKVQLYDIHIYFEEQPLNETFINSFHQLLSIFIFFCHCRY